MTEQGKEDVHQIKKKKKLDFGDKDSQHSEENVKPQELIKVGGDDTMLIKNFDVDFDEEGPDLRLLGGIRGIRALKVQRDYM